MKHHFVCSPRFPCVVVLVCVLLSLDTTLGSSNHDDLSREEQDRGGMMIEVSSSNGSSSDDSSRKTVTRKATKKNTATPTSTPTPTLQMFLEQYPEVKDQSSEAQDHLYTVYLLHLDGATPEDLEKYETVALNAFLCCKDGATSTGCIIWTECDSWWWPCTYTCEASSTGQCKYYNAGGGITTECCRVSPNSRVGTKAWPWTSCV